MDRNDVDLAAKLISKAQSTEYEAEAIALVRKAHELLGGVVGEQFVASRSVEGAHGSDSGDTPGPLPVDGQHEDGGWRCAGGIADPYEAADEEALADVVRHIDVFA
ncbi:MAG TPA: DUF2786 domain-containing protein [Acidimicrobiales bacterium]|nr:DUF2786 domain-containing protein [Acidimicrobiales bacterium]